MSYINSAASVSKDNYRSVVGGIIVLLVLYLAGLYNYNLFHSLAELFSIVVACSIFIIAWNSRSLLNNNYLLFVGIAYLFVGGIDLVHTLAYKGMGVFAGFTANLPTQLWIAARYTESISLLAAPLFLGRKLPTRSALIGYLSWSALLLLSIFYWRIFPDAFIEGTGLTAFKVTSEYIICLILVGALVLLFRKRNYFEPAVLRLLAASIVITIFQELAFTLYVDPYGLLNQVGHYLKIVAFYLVYKALVETGLLKPYSLLFRELKQSEERFRLLVDGAKDYAIFMLDPNGMVASWNDAARLIKGYKSEEIIGQPFSRFYATKDIEAGKPERELQVALETGSYEDEGWHLRQDGSQFWASAVTSAVVDESGNPIGFVRVVRDMTERKRAEELSNALAETNAAIMSTLDFDEIMHQVTERAARALGADAAVTSMREDKSWIVSYAYGFTDEVISIRFSDESSPITALAASTQKPVPVNDAQTDERVNHELMKRHRVRSFFSIPLLLKDDVIAVLDLHYRTNQVDFNDWQVDFANMLSTSVSLALENVRLYQAERRIADTLQSAILTVPKALPGLEFGYLYRSATEIAKIGGDFYDFFELDNNRIGFVIGDVSGKGLEAAAIASMVKNTIRAFAYRDPDPAYVLSETNNSVERQLEMGQFITAIYGVLDIETGNIVMASAGHPDPFLCGSDGCVQQQAKRNQPLGILPGVEFKSFEARLNCGDAMVLYTDGLIEAKGKDGLFGDERVSEVLNEVSLQSTKDIVDSLLVSAERFTDYKLSDDIAIIAFRYIGIANKTSFMVSEDVPV